MSLPRIATREAWLAARKELLAKEKDLTRLRDEPRVRVPAVTPPGYGWPSHACGVALGIRHRCWGVIAGPAHPAVDQPARRRYLGEDRRRTLLAGVVEDPGQELVAAEGSLRLADHHCVEAAAGVGEGGQELAGFGAALRRDRPGLVDVEELGHDHSAVRLDQRLAAGVLPGAKTASPGMWCGRKRKLDHCASLQRKWVIWGLFRRHRRRMRMHLRRPVCLPPIGVRAEVRGKYLAQHCHTDPGTPAGYKRRLAARAQNA